MGKIGKTNKSVNRHIRKVGILARRGRPPMVPSVRNLEKEEEDKLLALTKFSHPANIVKDFPNLRSLRTPMKTENVEHMRFTIDECMWEGCGTEKLSKWIIKDKFFLDHVVNSIPLKRDWIHGFCLCREHNRGDAIGNSFFSVKGVISFDADRRNYALEFLREVRNKLCLMSIICMDIMINCPNVLIDEEPCSLDFIKSKLISITGSDPTGVCFGYDKDLIHPHMRAAKSAIRYATRKDFSLLKEIIDLRPHYLQMWVPFFFDIVERLKLTVYFEDPISRARVVQFRVQHAVLIPPNFLDEIPENSIVRCIFKTCICAARHDDVMKCKLSIYGLLSKKCPNIMIRKLEPSDPDYIG